MTTESHSTQQAAELTERQARQREAILKVLAGEVAVEQLSPTPAVASLPPVPQVAAMAVPRPAEARRKPARHRGISLPHGARRDTYVVALLLFVPLLIGALWVAVYEVGVGVKPLGAIGSIVPLPVGSIDGEVIYAKGLVARVRGVSSAGGGVAVSPADAFTSLADELVIRHELARRSAPVSEAEVKAALQAAIDQFGSDRAFSDFVQLRYGWTVEQYRDSMVRPHLERQGLATALVGDRSFSVATWEQAERAVAGSGTVGFEDLGWLTAADLSPEIVGAIGGLVPNVRSAPLATSAGLVVLLLSDQLTDDDGVQHWHVWRRYVPVQAVEAFLEQTRQQASVRYFLPR